MCGIVGYTGSRQALPLVLQGLRRLEYRGYDSSGIAVLDGAGGLNFAKKAGVLANLEGDLEAGSLTLTRSGRYRAYPLGGKVTADEIESTPRPRESRVRGATYPDSLRCGTPQRRGE